LVLTYEAPSLLSQVDHHFTREVMATVLAANIAARHFESRGRARNDDVTYAIRVQHSASLERFGHLQSQLLELRHLVGKSRCFVFALPTFRAC
jgi:hypothetical protein